MNNHIQAVNLNIFSGKFNQRIILNENLNIISGINGSGKTQFLSFIQKNKSNSPYIELFNPADSLSIASFSPKRNSQRILIEQAQQIIRQANDPNQSTLNTFLNKELQDDNIQTIQSISEYLILSADKLVDHDNKTKEEAVVIVQQEYQDILKQVFDYEINFSWNSVRGKYESTISKNVTNLNFNQLSSGENALIALIFAIFYSKDNVNTYLIDEPEIHLNWQLEEKLFQFFDGFSKKYSKQLIIVTHSRVCFVEPFINLSKFFIWEGENLISKDRPSPELVSSLSGDVVKIVNGITSQEKIIYVEDNSQKAILEKIFLVKDLKFEITILHNCGDVKRQAEAFKNLIVDNVYFLIDGDNKKIGAVELARYHRNLIQLDRYCVENYLLDEETLSNIDKNNPKKDIKNEIYESVKSVNQQNFVPVKTLLTNKDALTNEVIERLDASAFINNLLSKLGFSNKNEFIESYINEANRLNRIDIIFEDFISRIL